jgi:polysaccharide biosynthesis protein PslF
VDHYQVGIERSCAALRPAGAACRKAGSVFTRFGFVSTYPPTLCGLATFTSALCSELMTVDDTCQVIRVVDAAQQERHRGSEVAGEIVAGDPASARRAARLLNRGDVAVVQHEYGIYGGWDGSEILPLLAALTVPSVVVLHTVLSAPTAHQREVLEAVAALSSAVVTMTAAARDRLETGYAIEMTKVVVIPHGASAALGRTSPSGGSDRPTVLTWGLIGPGKGIEWAVEAMSLLRDLDPAPRYLIAGRTHPKVLLHQGESYRTGLQQRVHELGLDDVVTMDDRYRDSTALTDLVNSVDVVLLPYDSTEQVTSGVLIEALAALKPVVATRFPHAVELLAGGAGLLVPRRDPVAIAEAVRTLLTGRGVTDRITAAAVATVPAVLWSTVAEQYRNLAGRLIRARVSA